MEKAKEIVKRDSSRREQHRGDDAIVEGLLYYVRVRYRTVGRSDAMLVEVCVRAPSNASMQSIQNGYQESLIYRRSKSRKINGA
jgi:hypothetical protein